MIRLMTLDDLDSVMEIEREAFSDHWTRAAYEYELQENVFSNFLVYEQDTKIIGVIGYYIIFDDAQITTIATRLDYRHQHIASQLMDAMIIDCETKQCSMISLEVRVSNQAAIQLYEKYEFINVNTRKQYYEDQEDAYLMIKALGGSYE